MSDKAKLKKLTLKTPLMDLEWESGGKGQSFLFHFINGVRRFFYKRWKNKKDPIRILNFQYLTYHLDKIENQTDAIFSLIEKQSWHGENVDEWVLEKENVYNVDNNIFALSFDLKSGCLDYDFNPDQYNGDIVEFIIDDQLVDGGLYVMACVLDEKGRQHKKCINLTTLKSDPDIGPHGDGSYEWKSYVRTLNIKKGWQSIRVDISTIFKKIAFNGDYSFKNIIGLRVRGRRKLVCVNTYTKSQTSNHEISLQEQNNRISNPAKPEESRLAAKGPWTQEGDILCLVARDISPDAYYVWFHRPLSGKGARFKFDIMFETDEKMDIRLVAFGRRPLEYYQESDHLVVYCPWESGGLRIDALKDGKIENIPVEKSTMLPLVVGKNYHIEVRIEKRNAWIKIDNLHVLNVSDERIEEYSSRVDFYWGFSTVCGNIKLSNIVVKELNGTKGNLEENNEQATYDQKSKHPLNNPIPGIPSLVRSTAIRIGLCVIVFLALEIAVGWCVNQYGEGDNFLQKSVNSWAIYCGVLGIVAFCFPFVMGKNRLRLLKLWRGDIE